MPPVPEAEDVAAALLDDALIHWLADPRDYEQGRVVRAVCGRLVVCGAKSTLLRCGDCLRVGHMSAQSSRPLDSPVLP